jgi:protein SCO1
LPYDSSTNKIIHIRKIIAVLQIIEVTFALMKIRSYIVGIFFVLLFPIVCFFIVRSKGGDGHVKLPKQYGKIDSVKSGKYKGKEMQDTFWHRASNISLTNQLGKTQNILTDEKRKITLISFFDTKCNGLYQTLNGNMKFLQNNYKKADSLLNYITISTSAVADSLPVVRQYANALSANHDKWNFYYGDAAAIQKYLKEELNISNFTTDECESKSPHYNSWILLDPDKNIRGIYNPIDTIEIRRCHDDISLLMLEKKRPHFSNNNGK